MFKIHLILVKTKFNCPFSTYSRRCISMYVYTLLLICQCVYVCTYVYVIHIYADIEINIYIYNIYTCICVYIYILRCTYVHTYICTYLHIYISTYIHIYNKYIYIYVCVCVYIYIYVCVLLFSTRLVWVYAAVSLVAPKAALVLPLAPIVARLPFQQVIPRRTRDVRLRKTLRLLQKVWEPRSS